MSRQEEPLIWEMANKDLSALSLWLGDKQFFHGDQPSSLDCTVFGHLAQFLYIDIGFPQKVCNVITNIQTNILVADLFGKPLSKSCCLCLENERNILERLG